MADPFAPPPRSSTSALSGDDPIPGAAGSTPDPVALRALPSVEQVIQGLPEGSARLLPRPLLVRVVQEVIEELRAVALGRRPGRPLQDRAEVMERIGQAVSAVARERLQPVINATGVPLHTNLGRAPLTHALEALATVAEGYNTLEFSLDTGGRGRRGAYVERLLAVIAGAEAATMVNNCAGGLVLALRHLIGPERDEVVISRGELVEIGGSFRIPDILTESGATLREVGTTNRTRAADYRAAIGPRTALLLKVHQSNFAIQGFTEEAGLGELAPLAREHGIPLMHDLGSGAAIDTSRVPGLPHEPTPAESLAQGADLVCFSGDKLLGGPQAGVLAGRAELVKGIKREPFFRALRCNKLVFAAMEATAVATLEGGAGTALQQMLDTPLAALAERAETLAEALAPALAPRFGIQAVELSGRMGGGTLPAASMPSRGLRLSPADGAPGPQALLDRLRLGHPAVVGVIQDDAVVLDLRTVLPRQDLALTASIRHALDE